MWWGSHEHNTGGVLGGTLAVGLPEYYKKRERLPIKVAIGDSLSPNTIANSWSGSFLHKFSKLLFRIIGKICFCFSEFFYYII